MSDSDDSYGPPLPPGLKTSGNDLGSSDPPMASGSAMIGPILPPGLGKRDNPTSDSDSDSSSSAEESKHKSRKRVKKKHKKIHSSSDSDNKKSSKKRKHHSSSDSDSSDSSSGRVNIKHGSNKLDAKSEITKSVIGPVLPDSYKQENLSTGHSFGPSLPHGFSGSYDRSKVETDESDEDGIGPGIELQAREGDISAVQEFVDRSEKMKRKLTEQTEDAEQPKQRESWMTDLPADMGARFGLGNRQFRKGEAAQIDSSWTETPQEKANKKDSKKKKKDKDSYFKSEADKQAAKEIEEYNKKHRSESLLELHKKELKKKKKKEKKKNKGKEKQKERQPFDRERDLKVNRLDDAQRKAIIKRSQELGSRFKSGGTGTSFL